MQSIASIGSDRKRMIVVVILIMPTLCLTGALAQCAVSANTIQPIRPAKIQSQSCTFEQTFAVPFAADGCSSNDRTVCSVPLLLLLFLELENKHTHTHT